MPAMTTFAPNSAVNSNIRLQQIPEEDAHEPNHRLIDSMLKYDEENVLVNTGDYEITPLAKSSDPIELVENLQKESEAVQKNMVNSMKKSGQKSQQSFSQKGSLMKLEAIPINN
jgi:fructose-1,6-bisphosphatase